MADQQTARRLEEIAKEIAKLKLEFNAKIEANTTAIETQSALMLLAVASLETATDAVTTAVETMNTDSDIRHRKLEETLDEIKLMRVHLELITDETITQEDIAHDH